MKAQTPQSCKRCHDKSYVLIVHLLIIISSPWKKKKKAEKDLKSLQLTDLLHLLQTICSKEYHFSYRFIHLFQAVEERAIPKTLENLKPMEYFIQ